MIGIVKGFWSTFKINILVGMTILNLLCIGVLSWKLVSTKNELNETKLTLVNERAASQTMLANAQAKVRETETNLQTSAAQTRKATNEQVASFATQRDTLLKRVRIAEANTVRDALSRSGSATSNGAASQGSDGGELLGSLGEQDVQEAIRADTIRVNLAACYDQYNAARQALKP